jgi:hypothetical protein
MMMNRREILDQLDQAEAALRANLHRHHLDENARAHMERALSHVREAYIATNEIGKGRTVQQLAVDLDKVQCFMNKLQPGHQPAKTLKLKV